MRERWRCRSRPPPAIAGDRWRRRGRSGSQGAGGVPRHGGRQRQPPPADPNGGVGRDAVPVVSWAAQVLAVWLWWRRPERVRPYHLGPAPPAGDDELGRVMYVSAGFQRRKSVIKPHLARSKAWAELAATFWSKRSGGP